jgi:RNA polymerase sigma-70 factor, ECF subfamily
MRDPTVATMAIPVESPDENARSIAAAKAGDLRAFESLMRQHERMVLVTALRLLGNIEDAKDASQEVFLRLYRNLGKVEAATNCAGWLYRVTVNVCYDVGRKRVASVPVEDLQELKAEGENPQEVLTGAERRRVLEMSLRRLPPKERAALVLRDLEGLSTEEVARALGASEATVRSHVSKARVKMRDFVERYFRRRI